MGSGSQRREKHIRASLMCKAFSSETLFSLSQVADVGSRRRSFPAEIWNRPLCTEGRRGGRKRPVAGERARELTHEARLRHEKARRSPHAPTRVLEVYVETFVGLSNMYCPGYLGNSLLAQDCVLETAPATGTGTVGGTSIPRAG